MRLITVFMESKMRGIVFLSLLVAACSAASTHTSSKIIGGSLTTIDNYPSMTPILLTFDGNSFYQECGGSILNQRSILTAAHCFYFVDIPARWRFRVGSSYAHSGGVMHNIQQLIEHPNYNPFTLDSDVMILRSFTTIVYINNAVQPASIAGPNYNLPDNVEVWSAGWGATEFGGSSEQLRHVQVYSISQEDCQQRYAGSSITDNMLCSGILDVGGRDQCTGDSGGPVYHHGVVVGITSWGFLCADARWPGVNVRVSRFTTWIQDNA